MIKQFNFSLKRLNTLFLLFISGLLIFPLAAMAESKAVSKPVIVAWVLLQQKNHNEWLGGTSSSPILQQLDEIAAEKGFSIVLPMLDIEDMSKLPAAEKNISINRVLEASKRYQADGIVLIKLNQQLQQWETQWRFAYKQQNFAWQLRSKQVNTLLKEGMFKIAKQITQTDPVKEVPMPNAHTETLLFTVKEVSSISDYSRMTRFLQSLAVLKEFEVMSVKSDEIIYKLVLTGNRDALVKALAVNSALKPLKLAADEEDTLVYRLIS